MLSKYFSIFFQVNYQLMVYLYKKGVGMNEQSRQITRSLARNGRRDTGQFSAPNPEA